MKKLIVLLVLVVGMTSAMGQGCLPNGISFTTQEEIDNFPVNYPGCTEIEGSVYIDGYDGNIANLNGLSGLTSIGGELNISWTYGLTSLTGLEDLTFIGGDFTLDGNESLISLTALDGLTTIGGSFGIVYNSNLINLTGLEGLTSIGGSLGLSGCAFTTINGLEELTSVGGGLYITFNSFATLTGLEGITSIGGPLFIWSNNNLNSLAGLDNVQGGSITTMTIRDNPMLTTCNIQSICSYLSAPNGKVEIYNNGSGCNNPGEIAITCGIQMPCLPFGDYYFSSQEDIDNFGTNFPGCTELTGKVVINDYLEGNITNLNGLSVLSSITGNLIIEHNDELVSIAGLAGLDSIGGYLDIFLNSNLNNLTGLGGLTSIVGIEISNNYGLTSITGLEGLSSIEGNLKIYYNDDLTSLIGISGLNSIGGNLYIRGNSSLINLTGLEGLNSIGGELWINDNSPLNSLSGLENIQANSLTNLNITYNPNLSDCDVISICQYLALPYPVYILYNAPGCNSVAEVEEHCLTSVAENSINETITFFPNPATSFITIHIKEGIPIEEAIIYNHLGQKVFAAKPVNNTVDVSKLKPGIYYVEMATKDWRGRTKIIKQ